jgi:hypothetical protein
MTISPSRLNNVSTFFTSASIGNQYPHPWQVAAGVSYGPTGVEYTGTFSVVGTYLFDEQTADAYRVLPGRIIVRM